MKIAIAGTGYVGRANAILLAQHHEVTAVDVIPEKVDMVNRRESPIAEAYIEDYLKHKKHALTATLDGDSAYREAERIIIAAPTNYDDVTGHFDTRAVESILSQIQLPCIGKNRMQVEPVSGQMQTRQLQQAIDDLSWRGGGTLVLQPGVYRTGALHLKNGVELLEQIERTRR